MKKIIINGRFLVHRITGVERYAHEILRELDKLIGIKRDNKSPEFVLAIPPECDNAPDYQNIKVVKIGRLSNRAWEHVSYPRYVRKQRGIALSLCNVAPLPKPGIVCIHDAKVKAHPEYFSFAFRAWYWLLMNNQIKRADKILTVSDFSKAELVRLYKANPDKIAVIPNGWQHFEQIAFDENACEKYGLTPGKFYFTVGSLEPNKNFGWILRSANNDPNQIYAVAGGINKQVFATGVGIAANGNGRSANVIPGNANALPDNVKLLGYVSDEEMKTLMRDCKAFLFPSFYEGFGIPPLEALSAGAKQVVVSDTAVMHEIFGDAVCFIDPHGEGLRINGSDASVDREPGDLRRYEILNKYSWEKSARKLYDLILEL